MRMCRGDGGNHERKEEVDEDLARIDVNEILSALPPLPVSLRLTLVVLSCAAEEQKRIIQESVGDKKRHFGVRLSEVRPIHRKRQPQSECDVCGQIAPLFL